jgi:hypothetical protein
MLGSVEEIGEEIIVACAEMRLDYWITGGG